MTSSLIYWITTIRLPALLTAFVYASLLLISACTYSIPTSSQESRSTLSSLCETKTRLNWASYGIGEIKKIHCLNNHEIYGDDDFLEGDYQISPTIVYFSQKWAHKQAKNCLISSANILRQCGIQVSEGKIIEARSRINEKVDSRSKVAILRSRIGDQNFSRLPTFFVASSYMENVITVEGEEKTVNGFVTRGGDDSNNAVIINASVKNNREKCGMALAHEWVHFIRDWPNNQFPEHDISGHHPSSENLLYHSLSAANITKRQCQQIIQNGIRRDIVKPLPRS